MNGDVERPLAYAADIRDHWQVHWAWEAYRDDDQGKIEKPAAQAEDSLATKAAHAAEGSRPAEPYTTWLETLDDLQARDTDLSARNPNQDDRVQQLLPTEITVSLIERTREFQSILLNLHEMLSNGDGN